MRVIFELEKLYSSFFQPPYYVPAKKQDTGSTVKGLYLSDQDSMLGVEVFLPVEIGTSDQDMLTLRCCTIRVQGKKTIVRTETSERKGSVKELFNVGDYVFSVKGVLIGGNGFPDKKIMKLRDLYETTEPVYLHNALAELFMGESRRVVIENIEFPEVQGSDVRHRPFTFTCETDFVEELIIAE